MTTTYDPLNRPMAPLALIGDGARILIARAIVAAVIEHDNGQRTPTGRRSFAALQGQQRLLELARLASDLGLFPTGVAFLDSLKAAMNKDRQPDQGPHADSSLSYPYGFDVERLATLLSTDVVNEVLADSAEYRRLYEEAVAAQARERVEKDAELIRLLDELQRSDG